MSCRGIIKLIAITRTIILPIEAHPALKETLDEAIAAYRLLSEVSFSEGLASCYKLHKSAYATLKAQTRLTAQMTCSAIRKVSSAYKAMKSTKRLSDEPPASRSCALISKAVLVGETSGSIQSRVSSLSPR